jgi:DNA-binding transcriptional regulator YdaS (Cro superfamily)
MRHFHNGHGPDAPAIDRWFDLREYQPGHCYACDCTGEDAAGAPCPVCRPIAHGLAQPVAGDSGKADRGPADSPLARAEYLVDHPEVTASHAQCRQLISELYMLLMPPRPAIATGVEALQEAITFCGGQSALASAIGLSQSHVWNWLNRRSIPAEHCPAIERATGRAVRCEALRPDVDWAYLRALQEQAAPGPRTGAWGGCRSPGSRAA